MKRLSSYVMMPLFLTVLWLVLNDTTSPGQIALGFALSVALVLAASRLRPLSATPRRPLVMARLIRDVVFDIIRSNIAVARLIWVDGARSDMTLGFLDIQIDMQDPHGLAALACIVTYTPGTVWSGFQQEKGILTLHVLDLKDPEQWIRTIKDRYEGPLMEIFE